jgi:hypothetical protein
MALRLPLTTDVAEGIWLARGTPVYHYSREAQARGVSDRPNSGMGSAGTRFIWPVWVTDAEIYVDVGDAVFLRRGNETRPKARRDEFRPGRGSVLCRRTSYDAARHETLRRTP